MSPRFTALLVVAVITGLVAVSASRAGYAPVYLGPGYDSTAGGFTDISLPSHSAGEGVGVGNGTYYPGASGQAFRWDASGSPPVTLGNLGYTLDPASTYNPVSQVTAVAPGGTAVGYVGWFSGGTRVGYRPVRWDAGSTAATELGSLGSAPDGTADARALAINPAGTIVGFADKYVGGTWVGIAPVRWDAGSTTPTELGNIYAGYPAGQATGINARGTIMGYSYRPGGNRAVRWEAGSTTPTELGVINTNATGGAEAYPNDINDAGTIVGVADKYINGISSARYPVRWDAGSTAATELGLLSPKAHGSVVAINTAGTSVGYSERFSSDGSTNQGWRAVRWDAGSTEPVELATCLGFPDLPTNAIGYDINDAGYIVGYDQNSTGQHAVLWRPDGSILDLNDLIDPSLGLVLTEADSITNSGWVTGVAGDRAFLLNISAVLPEPTSVLLVAAAAPILLRRTRRAEGHPIRTA